MPSSGLSDVEAGLRLIQNGPNALDTRGPGALETAIREVIREPMLVLLLATVGVYMALGERSEAMALAVSVVAVVGLTLFQSVRAERALRALQGLNAPVARVRRGNRWLTVPAAQVVVGDLVEVAEGERVPADGALVDAQDLEVDEAILTGESAPVSKSHTAGGDAQQLFAATFAVRGKGLLSVTATGTGSRVGRIGRLLGEQEREQGPLQQQVRRLVLTFAALGGALSILLVGLQIAQDVPFLHALLGGLTLAIATIPEEFAVVLSVFLALGAWRMARQRALVRRPGAIETLGAVTVLCTDKTGTLTRNSMEVRAVYCCGVETRVASEAAMLPDVSGILRVAAAACAQPTHEPMEQALLRAAAAEAGGGLVRHYPFSKALPVVANVYAREGLYVACKGAPEQVLALCHATAAVVQDTTAALNRLSGAGLRVLGVAEARLPADTALPGTPGGLGLTWLGLVALEDPLRTEVPRAIAEAQAAGIRVLLITGDYPNTARAIAQAAAIRNAQSVLTGDEIRALASDDELIDRLASAGVLARVLPEDKLRIVRALTSRGEVAAMTGDGVNDAPALAAAHVGIAMGVRGTEVAKAAASVVLADDNFATIVTAIASGRQIHDNLRQAVQYIVAVHIPITGAALLPVLMGAPMLLLPVHVLLLELLIDPASSLAFERLPPAPDVMQRPPRRRAEPLMPIGAIGLAGVQGLASLFAVVLVYVGSTALGYNRAETSTLAFVSIVVGNLGILAVTGAFHRGAEMRRTLAHLVLVVITVLLAVVMIDPIAAALRFAVPPAAAVASAVLSTAMILLVCGIAIRRLQRRHKN